MGADRISAELPLLVVYWAEWCAPCKAMAPVMDGMAKEYYDRLRVIKMGGKVQIAFN